MADVKISELASAGVPESTAVLPIVSSGTTKKVSISGIAQALGVDNGVVTLVNTTSPLQGGPIFSSGTLSILAATSGNPGSMSAADKTKLDAATNSNIVNTLVKRDSSGDFSAGDITATSFVGPLTGNVTGNLTGNSSGTHTGPVTGNVTGNLTGNASSATVLATSRSINVSGDVTGTAQSFNGSANITIPTAITADTIVNSDINSAAAIAFSKLASLATGQVLAGNAGVPTAMTVSGDATISNTGVLTLSSNSVGTSQISDSSVTTAKIADSNITTAKIANANVTDDKLNTTGVSAASYGAAPTLASVQIPYFTVSSKGRITSAGVGAFPGLRAIQRKIYNSQHDVNNFIASTITVPGLSSLNWGGQVRKNLVTSTSEYDIFGNSVESFTPLVAGSKIHYKIQFHISTYTTSEHILAHFRLRAGGSEIKKVPYGSSHVYNQHEFQFEHWYPSTNTNPLTFTFTVAADVAGWDKACLHYSNRWIGQWADVSTGNQYIAPQVIITEWI